MSGPAAGPLDALRADATLPRRNGELVFDEPWQGRALALAVELTRTIGLDWDQFRSRLIAALAAEPERGYYESWLVALEDLVVTLGLTPASDSLQHP